MRYIVFLFLLLPSLLWGQYPNNPRKQRLGYQTTGAGLVYIKSGAPAHTPSTDEDAWMVLDTTNNALYYWDETAGDWENFLDDFTRDTVFRITNVPDTALLVPLQGDVFINAAGDTMGVYAAHWELFYGGAGLTGSGTTGNLARWASSSSLTDADITDNGSVINIGASRTEVTVEATDSVLVDGPVVNVGGQPSATIRVSDTDETVTVQAGSLEQKIAVDDFGLNIQADGGSYYLATGSPPVDGKNHVQAWFNGSAQWLNLTDSLAAGGGGGDNLGDHTATTDLDMDGNNIQLGGGYVIGGTGTGSDLIFQTTTGAGDVGSDVIFLNGNNGASESVRIKGDGDVGIGTSSPTTTLDVNGAARLRATSAPTNTGGNLYTESTGTPRLHFQDGVDDWPLVRGAAEDFTAGSLLFAGTSGQAQQDNANFFVDDTNNRLGLGTTSPQQRIHIEGNARFRGSDWRMEILVPSYNQPTTFGSIGEYAARIFGGGSSGMLFQSFSNNAGAPGIRFQGHVGGTTITVPALTFEAFKNDGGTGRAELTGNNVAMGVYTGEYSTGTKLLSVHPNGTVIGAASTPSRTLHVAGEMRVTDLTTDTPTRIVGADGDGDFGAIAFTSTYIPIGSSGSLTENSGLKYVSTTGSRLFSSEGRVDLNTLGEEQGYTGASLTDAFFVDIDPDWEPAQDSTVLSLIRLRHRGTSDPGSGGTRRLLLNSEDASGGNRAVQLWESGLKLNRGAALNLYDKFIPPSAWLEIGETSATGSYISTYDDDDGSAGNIVHDFRQDYTKLGTHKLNTDQTVGSAQDGYVERYNHSSGEVELSPVAQSGSGAPAVAPRFNGDRYFDYTNSKWYSAWDNEDGDGTGDGLDADDWIILN